MTVAVENMLKQYKENKAYVASTMARIEAYEELLRHDDIEDYILNLTQREFGMPRSPGFNATSPIELSVMEKQLTADDLKQLIADEKSRIWLKCIEIEQIEIAIDSLTKPEKFIIECKYFEGMFWRNIERSFNDMFKHANDVTEEWLRKVNKDCLVKLAKILEPFCQQWKIS